MLRRTVVVIKFGVDAAGAVAVTKLGAVGELDARWDCCRPRAGEERVEAAAIALEACLLWRRALSPAILVRHGKNV